MKKENDMNKEEFNNEEKHQSDVEMKPLRRKNFIYDFVLGGIVDRIKNKFYNILNIDNSFSFPNGIGLYLYVSIIPLYSLQHFSILI